MASSFVAKPHSLLSPLVPGCSGLCDKLRRIDCPSWLQYLHLLCLCSAPADGGLASLWLSFCATPLCITSALSWLFRVAWTHATDCCSFMLAMLVHMCVVAQCHCRWTFNTIMPYFCVCAKPLCAKSVRSRLFRVAWANAMDGCPFVTVMQWHKKIHTRSR